MVSRNPGTNSNPGSRQSRIAIGDRVCDGRNDSEANGNFLSALGYTLEEIRGVITACSVDRSLSPQSPAQREFWANSIGGVSNQPNSGVSAKMATRVWIQAIVQPHDSDLHGKPYKVLTLRSILRNRNSSARITKGQIQAVRQIASRNRIRYGRKDPERNDNFLNAMGYTLEEVKGRHHSMFVDEAYRHSPEYKDFWARLNRGEYQTAEYKRIGKAGGKYGFKAPIIRSLIRTGNRSRW